MALENISFLSVWLHYWYTNFTEFTEGHHTDALMA